MSCPSGGRRSADEGNAPASASVQTVTLGTGAGHVVDVTFNTKSQAEGANPSECLGPGVSGTRRTDEYKVQAEAKAESMWCTVGAPAKFYLHTA